MFEKSEYKLQSGGRYLAANKISFVFLVLIFMLLWWDHAVIWSLYDLC